MTAKPYERAMKAWLCWSARALETGDTQAERVQRLCAAWVKEESQWINLPQTFCTLPAVCQGMSYCPERDQCGHPHLLATLASAQDAIRTSPPAFAASATAAGSPLTEDDIP